MSACLHLNGQQEDYPSGITNLQSLVVHMMERSEPLNELVVDVKVDGEYFSEEYAHQAGEIGLSQIDRVEIRTLTAEVFSRQFLDQASEYIDYLKNGFSASIRHLRIPEDEEIGFDMLARCIETMGTLKKHLENVRETVEKSNTGIDASIVSEQFENMVDHLYRAQVAGSDPVVIADLLEEKVLPFLETWKETA